VIIEGEIADCLLESAVQTLIAANTMAQNRVYEIRTWPMRAEQFMPAAVMVSTPNERKESLNRGVPEFNVTVVLLITARVAKGPVPDEDLSKSLRQLKREIENALLGSFTFMQPIQQFKSIETMQTIDTEGQQPYGELKMAFEAEIFQIYEPNVSTPLTDIRGTITDETSGETLVTVDVPYPT
jgi:hypothetical protein